MSKIKILDQLTIQKIAAGEIIERPSSIVKELVENSLDANSSNITIEINNGGKSYIRITDDGEGFSEEDLKIAFKRHSTSKLTDLEDLHRIISFGFRGEALASISTVAKVEVITKSKDNLSGIQAFVEEGKIVKQRPVGCPKGTTMIIRDLFYNVPVRQKFLKGDLVESNYISDIVYRLALGNSGIAFKYIRDNKIIFNTSKKNNLLSNIYTLLGKEFSKNLIEIKDRSSIFNIYGYISNNVFYRSNRSHQYLYVNNRYIKMDSISSLIEGKYKTIIPNNKFPVFILFIDIAPSYIDINIHPTKQEIKFIDQQKIHNEIEYIIGHNLEKALSIPKVAIKQEEDPKIEELPLLYDEILYDKEYLKYDSGLVECKDYTKDSDNKIIEEKSEYINDNIVNESNNKNSNGVQNIFSHVRIIGLLFSTYILVEDFQQEKLFIIDQHAAHERIMYEKYRKEYEKEAIVIQNLLTPEVVQLNNSEFESVVKNISLMKKMGYVVEEFGDNSVILRGVPIIFGKPQDRKMFLELVDTLDSNINSSYEMKIDKIIKIACSKAIKSGDMMTKLEIESLLQQLSETGNPYTCPHGRPTISEISKQDIEKEFKRIM